MEPAPFGTRLRSLAFKFLLLAGSLVVATLLLEAFVRLAGQDAPAIWEPDPELGWRHIPGATLHWTSEGDGWVQINDLGLRDRRRELAKAPGVVRIAVFGDSMTEAVQVNLEQTFTYVLEERLRREKRPVEVLNFGNSGYSPVQELLQLRREGPRFKPDLVVLAVFLDNDVADCHSQLRYSQTGITFAHVADGKLQFDFSHAKQSYADYHREPIHSARAMSALYRAVSKRIKELPIGEAGGGGAPAPSASIPRRYQLYNTSEPQPKWEEAWATLEKVIEEFAAECERQEASLVILSVPSGELVSAAAWQETLKRSPAMADVQWDLERPQQRLVEIAERHGIHFLSTYRKFQSARQDPPLFLGDYHGHFSSSGHQLMAECIHAFLIEKRLLPAGAHE
jgi:hypothetical protein